MAEPQPPKLLDQARQKPGTEHYSIRTEEAYLGWIRRFILFHNKRHPREMGEEEISAFLTHLAVQGKVAASTQNQVLFALLFLYGEILEQDLDKFQNVVWAKKPVKLPVVFTRQEVRAVPARMDGTCRLMASLPYGSGPRLMECPRLRALAVFIGRLLVVQSRRYVQLIRSRVISLNMWSHVASLLLITVDPLSTKLISRGKHHA